MVTDPIELMEESNGEVNNETEEEDEEEEEEEDDIQESYGN